MHKMVVNEGVLSVIDMVVNTLGKVSDLTVPERCLLRELELLTQVLTRGSTSTVREARLSSVMGELTKTQDELARSARRTEVRGRLIEIFTGVLAVGMLIAWVISMVQFLPQGVACMLSVICGVGMASASLALYVIALFLLEKIGDFCGTHTRVQSLRMNRQALCLAQDILRPLRTSTHGRFEKLICLEVEAELRYLHRIFLPLLLINIISPEQRLITNTAPGNSREDLKMMGLPSIFLL